jgi:hypothetical protein
MKQLFPIAIFSVLIFATSPSFSQQNNGIAASSTNPGAAQGSRSGKQLFMDVHHVGPGKLTNAAVAGAHVKDLEVEGKYGVEFIKYWVDTAKGEVYCLAYAKNGNDLTKTHAEAHGLLPDHVYPVTGGAEATENGGKRLFLDVHELGAGNVKAADVAAAHQKDLAVQAKYGVNLINYWVNEKDGVIMCLAEAPDANALINTHKEAHGLLPNSVSEVKQGQ